MFDGVCVSINWAWQYYFSFIPFVSAFSVSLPCYLGLQSLQISPSLVAVNMSLSLFQHPVPLSLLGRYISVLLETSCSKAHTEPEGRYLEYSMLQTKILHAVKVYNFYFDRNTSYLFFILICCNEWFQVSRMLKKKLKT